MNLGSQRSMKMDCVVREPFPYLGAQPREALFSSERRNVALEISLFIYGAKSMPFEEK
jgi:hypothetical protein